jgi:lysophospholipase L1-like esterase
MPVHAARAAFGGLAVAAVLLLVVGPQRAGARTEPVTTPAASSSPSPSPSPTTSGPYRVVGLGDSVPAGTACGCTPYVSLTGRGEAARRGTTAEIADLAQPGLTTDGLLAQLGDASVRRRIAAADLVVITIGANDFDTDDVASASCRGPALTCFQPTLKRQQGRLGQAFERVETLLGGRSATVLVTGYWNVFLDGDVAAARGTDYVRNSVALTRAENAQISAAAQRAGATYVDLFTPFKGPSGTKNDTSLLAGDGDHPDAAGHRRIARALEAALT